MHDRQHYGRHRKVIMQMRCLSVLLSKHAACSAGGHVSVLPQLTSAHKPSEEILYFASWFHPARVHGGNGPPLRQPLMPRSDRDIVRQSYDRVTTKDGDRTLLSAPGSCTCQMTSSSTVASLFIVIIFSRFTVLSYVSEAKVNNKIFQNKLQICHMTMMT